jgi:hypothetical protein
MTPDQERAVTNQIGYFLRHNDLINPSPERSNQVRRVLRAKVIELGGRHVMDVQEDKIPEFISWLSTYEVP